MGAREGGGGGGLGHLTFFSTTTVESNFSYCNMNIHELFCKLLQNTTNVITICDSSYYYKTRQRVTTIYDRYVITNHDNCYYNLLQVLQFTIPWVPEVIIIIIFYVNGPLEPG